MRNIYEVVDNETNNVYLITNFPISIKNSTEDNTREVISDETNDILDTYNISVRVRISKV